MVRSKLTIRDVAGIAVLLVGGAFLAGPALARMRTFAKRGNCEINLDRVGTASIIYSNDNQEKWPTPAYKQSLVGQSGIDYLNNRGIHLGEPTDPGEVGFDRSIESRSETQIDPDGGSDAVSVTRSFWILVRSGDVAVDQLVCPSTNDKPDPSEFSPWGFEPYFDFAGYNNISYGLLVPFAPRHAPPPYASDNRRVVMADKGPYYLDRFEPSFVTRRGIPIEFEDARIRWRPFNSPNHAGLGQNVLRADGSASFFETPLAGVHADNIYTLMTDEWDETAFNRIHGESPHYASVPNPYPGQDAMGPGLYSSTDSLIYP